MSQILDDILDVEIDNVFGEGFHCDSKEKAIWAAAKLKRVRDEQAENNATIEAVIAKHSAWLALVNEKLEGNALRFESYLREYAENRRATDPKFKSELLPDARVKFRKRPDDYARDEAVILEYVRANVLPFVQVKESLKWAELKKRLAITGDGAAVLTDTGEIVPGIVVTPGCEEFSVEIVASGE